MTVVLCEDGETVCEVIVCSDGAPCEVITCGPGDCVPQECVAGTAVCEVSVCPAGGGICETIVCDGETTCEVVVCGDDHACPEAAPTEPPVQVPRIDVVRDITFPIVGPVYYYPGFGDCRDGCRREHHGVDLMTYGWKGLPVVAAHDGTVTKISPDVGNGGCSVRLEGADGWHTRYLHMNNDQPGTDNAQGGFDNCIVPGLSVGDPVEEGQLIGWVGDSGNAEGTAPHIHFEIRTPEDLPVDPYPSLEQARRISFERVDQDEPALLAVRLSEAAYPDGADSVYVTAAVDPDPWYSNAQSSGRLDGPLLVTRTDGLDGVTRREILRLAPKRITIVGDALGIDAVQAIESLADSVRKVMSPVPTQASADDGIERPEPNIGEAPPPFSLMLLDERDVFPAERLVATSVLDPPTASEESATSDAPSTSDGTVGSASHYPLTLEQFMTGIRGAESGGNYAHVNPNSGAFGAYQFLERYAGDYIRYAEMNGVPIADPAWPPDPATQDALAAGVFDYYHRQYGGNWSLVATAWHCGHLCADEAVSVHGVDATPAEIDEAVGARFGPIHGNESEYIYRAYNSSGVEGAIEWVGTMGGTTWRNDPGPAADPNYEDGIVPAEGHATAGHQTHMRSHVESLLSSVPTLVLDTGDAGTEEIVLDDEGAEEAVADDEEFPESSIYEAPDGSYEPEMLYYPTEQGFTMLPAAAEVWEAPAYDTGTADQRQTEIVPPAEPGVIVLSGSDDLGPTLAFFDSLAAAPFMPYWR